MLLKAGFIGLSILITLIFILIGFKTINKTFTEPQKRQQKKWLLILGLTAWHAYIYFLSKSGILDCYTLPPRVAIFLIIPIFTFTGLFIYSNRKQQWLQNINPKFLVVFQTFRILVETLFVFSLAANVLHRNVTIEGYNFDMLFALTAPFVWYFAFSSKWFKKLILVWNLLGLVVLASVIFVFITTVYFPEFYGSSTKLMSTDFVRYPFVLIAGFLMPSAVFVHVLSLAQLKNINTGMVQ